MKTEIADELRVEYEHLWHDCKAAVPDGWTQPLVSMLGKLERLSDIDRSYSRDAEGLATWVDLRIEVSDICATAYATPLRPAGKWRPGRALACIDALAEFSGSTGETCRVCGVPGALRLPNFGDPIEGVFCNDHNARAHDNPDRAAELYAEVRDLFPPVHGKTINFNLRDCLHDPVAKLLDKAPDVDGVFCLSDDLALGVLFECQRLGIRVPEDFGICGYNDLDFASCTEPGLTTIRVPRFDMGYRAADVIIRAAEAQCVPQRVVEMRFELIQRGSTRGPR